MQRIRFAGAATLGVVALMLSACADADDGLAPGSPNGPQGASLPSHAHGSPPDRAALARAVPGFGGIFLEDGAPTVYLTDTGRRPELVGALSAWLAQEGYAPGQVRVRQGDYDFEQLAGWFAAASREAFAAGGVVFVDLHEPSNRVVVAVENQGAAAGARAAALRAGVPAEALTIEVREPIRLLRSLTTEFPQIVGGIQINFPGFLCTLGFPATQGAQTYFVTNSHCTNKQGGVDDTPYWQPLESANPEQMGLEVRDPLYSKDLADCPRGRNCRYSDASLALAMGSRAFNVGEIAAAPLGSLDANGVYSIASAREYALHGNNCILDGTVVHKVGRTTGHTQGTVDGSCIAVGVLGSNIAQLEQVLVVSGSTIIGSGDSGSPAFTLSGNNAVLEGIAWGGSTTELVFSPFPNIELELGQLGVTGGGGTPPPPAGLDAAFSYSCGNSDSCSFDASASTGSITGYSWTFGDGDNGSGETTSHSYGSEDDFTVTLTVTDGTSDDTATAMIACRQRGPNLRCR